jgi:hypothetical protein
MALGIAKDFTRCNLALTVEGYYKKSKNVIGYKEGASFLLIDDPTTAEELSWERNITSGQGWSYGAEVCCNAKRAVSRAGLATRFLDPTPVRRTQFRAKILCPLRPAPRHFPGGLLPFE